MQNESAQVTSPELSIIVPVFRCQPFLADLVRSLKAQTFLNWECVVVDDGSHDGTLDRFREIVQGDTRFFFFEKEPEGLPAKTRNFAMQRAQGDFLAFLDHDDLWHPEKLALQVAAMKRFPNCQLSCTEALTFLTPSDGIFPPLSSPKITCTHAFHALARKNFICTSTVMIRREVLETYGYFSEDLNLQVGEDYLYWLRIAQNSPIVKIERPLTLYRQHTQNLTKIHARLVLGLQTIADIWEHEFPNSKAAKFLRAQALKSEAVEIFRQHPLRAALLLWKSLLTRMLSLRE